MAEIEFLLKKYGPLLALADLAELLRRSEDGLRVSLRKQDPFYHALRSARVRHGRRIYFKTIRVAEIILSAQEGS